MRCGVPPLHVAGSGAWRAGERAQEPDVAPSVSACVARPAQGSKVQVRAAGMVTGEGADWGQRFAREQEGRVEKLTARRHVSNYRVSRC